MLSQKFILAWTVNGQFSRLESQCVDLDLAFCILGNFKTYMENEKT